MYCAFMGVIHMWRPIPKEGNSPFSIIIWLQSVEGGKKNRILQLTSFSNNPQNSKQKVFRKIILIVESFSVETKKNGNEIKNLTKKYSILCVYSTQSPWCASHACLLACLPLTWYSQERGQRLLNKYGYEMYAHRIL